MKDSLAPFQEDFPNLAFKSGDRADPCDTRNVGSGRGDLLYWILVTNQAGCCVSTRIEELLGPPLLRSHASSSLSPSRRSRFIGRRRDMEVLESNLDPVLVRLPNGRSSGVEILNKESPSPPWCKRPWERGNLWDDRL